MRLELFKMRRGRASADAASAGHALAKILVERGDHARDQRRWRDAAVFYAEALANGRDEDAGLHIQAGHMFKEAGDYASAERHYNRAAQLRPMDADLAMQFGHFYKLSGRLRAAARSYRRAQELQPGWAEPQRELETLARKGLADAAPEGHAPAAPIGLDPAANAAELRRALQFDQLVPELLPRPASELAVRHEEKVEIRRLGRDERTFWGTMPTLRGVEAIRGFCISADPIVEMQIRLNDEIIHRGPTRGYPIRNERDDPDLRKYIFNVWVDLSGYQPGHYTIELLFNDVRNTPAKLTHKRSYRANVVIAEPLPEPLYDGGDAWTPPTDPDDPRSVEEQINARASVISDARSAVFKTPPKNVLVLRTDQLGDVVASVPAMRRLRTLLPDANIVGLFTAANVDLVRTLGVFDELIVIDFPDEKVIQRKRVMTAEAQEALREKLHGYKFDIALDLAPAVESRPLLLLSGAPFLAGMRDKNWPYITCGFDLNTYDPVGRSDIMPASSKTRAFIESLGIMMNGAAEVLRRDDLPRTQLEKFGIGPDDRYVIVHTGARVIFSRWAHYNALTQRILEQTDCKVVMLSENPETRAELPATLADNPRFQLLDQRLDFDDFDALLSYCACFVGNDSGPKHLAALRGSNVVSLHTARINWGEWGQEQTGKVIHRQVPCAGCHIYHDPEECGKDYACVALISVDEVWSAMQPYLEPAA
jgi:ADP-heptose:LPS heptosyltransferase